MSQRGNAPKKQSILELTKMIDSSVRVKCLGGRELKGILRGYDELVNLVLDDADEFLRGEKQVNYLFFSMNHSHPPFSKDPQDPNRTTDKSRKLGLVVVRGTQVSLVSPEEGMEEIANPFNATDDDA